MQRHTHPPLRRWRFLLPCLLFTATLPAQGWEKTYPVEGAANGVFVQPAAGGYAIVGNSSTDESGTWESFIFLLKTDGNGNQLSLVKAADGAGFRQVYKVLPLQGGGYLCAGNAGPAPYPLTAYALRLDDLGNEVWSVTFPGEADLTAARAAPGGGFLLGGSYFDGTSSYFHLSKLNEAGSELWNETYTLPAGQGWSDFVPLDDENFLVAGYANGSGYSDGLLLKLNKNTGVEWSKTIPRGIYGDGFQRIEQTGADEYLLSGYSFVLSSGNETWLAKTDGEGNAAWSALAGSWSGDSHSAPVKVGGDFALTGSFGAFWGGGNLVIHLLDAGGNFVFEKRYGGQVNTGGSHVAPTPDQQLVAVGSIFPGASSDGEVYLVKTDSLMLTAVRDIEKTSAVRVHPNPARRQARIALEENEAGKHRFELFDLQGRLVHAEKFSGRSFTFRRRALPDGMYFFTVTSERGKKASGKIVFR